MKPKSVYSKRWLTILIAFAMLVAAFFVWGVSSTYAEGQEKDMSRVHIFDHNEDFKYILDKNGLEFDYDLKNYDQESEELLAGILLFNEDDSVKEFINEGVTVELTDPDTAHVSITELTLMKLIYNDKLAMYPMEDQEYYHFCLALGIYSNEYTEEYVIENIESPEILPSDNCQVNFFHLLKPQLRTEDGNEHLRLYRGEDRQLSIFVGGMEAVQDPVF